MRTLHRRQFLLESAGLAAGLALPFRLPAEGEKPLTVLLFGGTLPEVQKELEKTRRARFLTAGAVKPRRGEKPARSDNVRGLEQLKGADVFIGSAQKRLFPSKEQLGHFQAFHAAGRPVVGYRACSHVFQNWLAIDRAVFGAKYGGHHLLGKEKKLIIEVAKGADRHPILAGLTPPPPLSGSYNYTELAPDVKVLLYSGLPGDLMPHTWVRENRKTGGRAFYTRYDARELSRDRVCRAIFLRGLAWALRRLS